jgi:hypothetical protein
MGNPSADIAITSKAIAANTVCRFAETARDINVIY